MRNPSTNQNHNLRALCALSDTPKTIQPSFLTKKIQRAPDPATALQLVLSSIPTPPDTLKDKWQKIVRDIWAHHHLHIHDLLDLPLTAADVAQTKALSETHTYLAIIANQPLQMIKEGKEWLIAPDEVSHLAAQLPNLHRQPTLPAESEWQYLPLRRLRSVLRSLRLIRRYRHQLVVVKSRYKAFSALPAVQQYYLLWHADTYHVEWLNYAGVWGDYLQTIQEYLPLLWDISHHTKPGYATDIRQWNHTVITSFYSLWQQEGLLTNQSSPMTLLSMIRFQSLPTALTQVILQDLFFRYGLIYGEGTVFAYTNAGTKLIAAEYNQGLPCNIDLLCWPPVKL